MATGAQSHHALHCAHDLDPTSPTVSGRFLNIARGLNLECPGLWVVCRWRIRRFQQVSAVLRRSSSSIRWRASLHNSAAPLFRRKRSGSRSMPRAPRLPRTAKVLRLMKEGSRKRTVPRLSLPALLSGCEACDTQFHCPMSDRMAAKHHRHVALTETLTSFVDQQVAEGRYASASEVMRAALRLLIERENAGARPAEEGSQQIG